jgi:hypothetical protein
VCAVGRFLLPCRGEDRWELGGSSSARAVCVNALVRICAGSDQQWSSLPRHVAVTSGLLPALRRRYFGLSVAVLPRTSVEWALLVQLSWTRLRGSDPARLPRTPFPDPEWQKSETGDTTVYVDFSVLRRVSKAHSGIGIVVHLKESSCTGSLQSPCLVSAFA